MIPLPLPGSSLPENAAQLREKVEKLADIVATGAVDAHKEQETYGDFVNHVFCELLGYARALDDTKRYMKLREKHVQAQDKTADASSVSSVRKRKH
jgi:hypothetical protein